MNASCIRVFSIASKSSLATATAMSDHSESPEVDETALDVPEDKLSAGLSLEEEEDSSLLDAGLGETAEEQEGDAGILLEESGDSVHIEDPVWCASTNV